MLLTNAPCRVYMNPSLQLASNESTMFLAKQLKLMDRLITNASSSGSARYWRVVVQSSRGIVHTSHSQGPQRIVHQPLEADIPAIMTLAESGSSPRIPHSRAALAVAHAITDGQHAIPLGSSIYSRGVSLPESEDHIKELVQRSRDAWCVFVNHPFPRDMANGQASLNGFRHYMIQDAVYLEYYDRFSMESIGNLQSRASFQDLEDVMEELSHSIQYSTDARSVCEKQLGVPKDVIANEPMSDQLRQSIELYGGIAREGDWIAMHIALLPCIMGYDTIANRLINDPATVRNTPYYPLWIQENACGGSFEKYKRFINENIERIPQNERKWDYWTKIFSTACSNEKAFFDLANRKSKYDIVKEGRYKIRNYGQDGAYLVAGDDGRVITQMEDPKAKGTWELTNGADGYSISIGTIATLGAFVADQFQFPPCHIVNSKGQGYRSWSIMPIPGQKLYQLLIPKLQFTLDVGNHSNVFVANNYQGSSQLWILEPVA